TKQTSGLLDFVSAVSPTPDGRRVAAVGCSSSTGCVAMLFDEDLKSLRTWPAAAQLGVWLSPDGERILFALQDKTPAVHDAQTGELLWRMPQDDPAQCALLAPDGRTIVSGHANGRVRVWDGKSDHARETWMAHPDGAVRQLSFDPSGQRLITRS